MHQSTTNRCRQELDRLVRTQRSSIVAKLSHRFGLTHLNIVEDALQEVLVTALSNWSYQGLPQAPEAWLYRATYNRVIDILRQRAPERDYDELLDRRQAKHEEDIDPELNLLFQCCQLPIAPMDQHLMMLSYVFGLSHREVSNLTLIKLNTVSKRISRAKNALIASGFTYRPLTSVDIETIIRTIYVCFSLGYFPRQGQQLLNEHVALEAVRLTLALLTERHTPHSYHGELHALVALMQFHASRFRARQSDAGLPILLQDQDRSLWDKRLIKQASYHLSKAQATGSPSSYHLEAAIAAIHSSTLNSDDTDWHTIHRLYQQLVDSNPSVGILISAAVAGAKIGNHQEALQLLDQAASRVDNYSPLEIARAEILRSLGDEQGALNSLQTALEADSSLPVQALLHTRF